MHALPRRHLLDVAPSPSASARAMAPPGDVDLLLNVAKQMQGKCLCALGEFSTMAVVTGIERFPQDFQKAVQPAPAPAMHRKPASVGELWQNRSPSPLTESRSPSRRGCVWWMPPRRSASTSPSSAIIPRWSRSACAACAWWRSAARCVDRATGQVVMENGAPKIQFLPKLETACTNPVEEGMVVLTQQPEGQGWPEEHGRIPADLAPARLPDLRQGRRMPAAEPDHGATGPARAASSSMRNMRLGKHVPLGDLIVLDQERCIQCARCIRFQDEIVGEPVLGFDDRGRAHEDRHLLRAAALIPFSQATPPTSARSAR